MVPLHERRKMMTSKYMKRLKQELEKTGEKAEELKQKAVQKTKNQMNN